MSRRVPSGPSPTRTGRTIQIAVRLPLDLHAALLARGRPISEQVVEAVRQALDAPTEPPPAE